MSDEPSVHEPDGSGHVGDGAPDEASDAGGAAPADDAAASQPRNVPEPQGRFDWRGWALVATVVFSFLIVPGALYLLPTVRSFVASLGLGLRHTYLVLPLLPALALGAVAVWSAVRARSR